MSLNQNANIQIDSYNSDCIQIEYPRKSGLHIQGCASSHRKTEFAFSGQNSVDHLEQKGEHNSSDTV